MALRRFSDNPAASTPLTGTEIIPGLQSGADVQMTAQDIADLAGTGGAEDFTDLADVPSSYTGEAGKLVAVNGTEDGLEFVSGSGGGSPDWGDIGGTLSDQTDLQSALDDKVDATDLAATAGAATVGYDNAGSGLAAIDVQAAIDEVAGLSGATTVSIVTEGSAFTVEPATHAGLARYIRAAGDATFDSDETYSAGMVFNIRATAAIELLEDGVTLTPPAGGTLELAAGMSVTVIMTSGSAGDVVGQTVAAP